MNRRLLLALIAAVAGGGSYAGVTLTSGPPPPPALSRGGGIGLSDPGVHTQSDLLSAPSPVVGDTLAASTGTWDHGPTSFTYQWEDCNSLGASCSNIVGATASTYVIVTGDIGHTIRVAVTATNNAGSATATWTQTGVVTAATGNVTFENTFENAPFTRPGTPGGLYDGAQFGNWGGQSAGAKHFFGDLYIDDGTSTPVTSVGTIFNAAGLPNVPAGAGSNSARIVQPVPPTGQGYTLEGGALNGPDTPAPGDLGTTEYYGLMFYLPALDAINSTFPSGNLIWEFHFNGVDGAPISWGLHTTGGSAVNGTGSSVVLNLETGACNSASSANPGCQYRSAAWHSPCTITSAPNIGSVDCLPGEFAMPPGSVQYSEWNELVMAVNWESTPTGTIQTWYKTKDTSTWTPGANVTGIPTVQWDVTSGCCGFPVHEALEQYGGLETAPFQINVDNQVIGTSLASVEAQMPTSGGGGGGTPVAPANTAPPSITGTPTQGNILTANPGSWSGTPTPTFSYQWEDCNSSGASCSNISMATASTYTLVTGDVGHTVRVVVTAANTGGNANATSAQTALVTAPSAFVAGVCTGGGCTIPTASTFHVTVAEASTGTGWPGSGTAATSSRQYEIARPGNLSTSSQAPAVIVTGHENVSSWQQWLDYAALKGFVVVEAATGAGSGGGNPGSNTSAYNKPSTDRPSITASSACAASGTVVCDDVPYIQGIVNAIECTGSPPCENINPNEVFIEGKSSGSTMATDAICDTRTSGDFAGASIISGSMYSPTTDNVKNAPNCPGLIQVANGVGAGGDHCYADCVSTTPNTTLSLQWIYGTKDVGYNSASFGFDGCGTGTGTGDCLGNGIDFNCLVNPSSGCSNTLNEWYLPVPSLATSYLGNALGCSSTPSSTITGGGQTGKITTTTYTSCTNAGAATQIVAVAGGGHELDTWPCANYTSLASDWCASSGSTDLVASDGLFDPAAAWTFWTSHFP